MGMTVNARAAQKCCAYCDTDYGKVSGVSQSNRRAVARSRAQFRRMLKRRERQEVQKRVDM